MLHSRIRQVLPLVVMVALVLSPRGAWSQSVYGKIAGTASDPSGAAVANARLTLTNLADLSEADHGNECIWRICIRQRFSRPLSDGRRKERL